MLKTKPESLLFLIQYNCYLIYNIKHKHLLLKHLLVFRLYTDLTQINTNLIATNKIIAVTDCQSGFRSISCFFIFFYISVVSIVSFFIAKPINFKKYVN